MSRSTYPVSGSGFAGQSRTGLSCPAVTGTIPLANRAEVDTRAEPEYSRAHVPGAISLGDADMSAGVPAALQAVAALKKAKRPVVVYCACPAEITSLRVAEALRAAGVNDVRALTGGWVEWFNAGNPVEPSR